MVADEQGSTRVRLEARGLSVVGARGGKSSPHAAAMERTRPRVWNGVRRVADGGIADAHGRARHYVRSSMLSLGSGAHAPRSAVLRLHYDIEIDPRVQIGRAS